MSLLTKCHLLVANHWKACWKAVHWLNRASHIDCQSIEIWFGGTFGILQLLLLFVVAAECVGTVWLHQYEGEDSLSVSQDDWSD